MLFRRTITLGVLLALLVPAFASAKVLTTVNGKFDNNPSLGASGFLEYPKQFRVTVTSNKNMDLDGSTITASCSKGDDSKTKVVVVRGKPRVTKKFKPAFKNATICFISMSIVGDKPGRLGIKLTGTKRKLHSQKPAVDVPVPDPVVPEPDPVATP